MMHLLILWPHCIYFGTSFNRFKVHRDGQHEHSFDESVPPQVSTTIETELALTSLSKSLSFPNQFCPGILG